ncbi:MAG: alkaline phosphatase, partial [Bacteroidetes bacterium]|nr:alkaline phosphatase [Bacteroidota bacterium]
TPILGPDRKNKNDNHANEGFQYEGDEIRGFIKQYDNVFICCGDRHWQYVSHLADSNLWEFSTGPGSDSHAGGWSQKDKRPEHRYLRVGGGYLFGQIYRENEKPVLEFQHCDVDGNVMHTEQFGLD